MHYTCQLVLRLCSVCEGYVFSMFTYLCVHFSVCFGHKLSSCPVFRNIQSGTCRIQLFYFFIYMYSLWNSIGGSDILQSQQVCHCWCLQSNQQHFGQLIGCPSPQSLVHFSFMSLTPFQLISLFLPYFPSLQLWLSNFLHLCHPFAFSDSGNLPHPLTPPFIALYASKCPVFLCLVALTHIILDSSYKVLYVWLFNPQIVFTLDFF